MLAQRSTHVKDVNLAICFIPLLLGARIDSKNHFGRRLEVENFLNHCLCVHVHDVGSSVPSLLIFDGWLRCHEPQSLLDWLHERGLTEVRLLDTRLNACLPRHFVSRERGDFLDARTPDVCWSRKQALTARFDHVVEHFGLKWRNLIRSN